MNKTIIININGIVFHIEEDAYEMLKNYMTDVKRHFMNSADSLEITTDIENRIAEMFNEILLNQHKQVIVEQDVKIVIEQMGTVEDFERAESVASTSAGAHNYETEARRLFRDPDDHLISGVCAGIANYFNINPIWVRLAFILSFFFAGTGILVYIILWIVVPKAVTRADKMAMKGEKLNLQGFKRNFEEELSAVKGHLSTMQRGARPLIYKVRDFIGDFFHHLGLFAGGAGKLFVKLFGIFILLMCLGATILLIISLIAIVGYRAGSPQMFFPLTVIEGPYANKIYVSAFMAAIIPVLAVALLTLKIIFNTRSVGRLTALISFVAWICAVSMLIFYGSKVSANYRYTASFNQTNTLKKLPLHTYYLKLNTVKYFTHEDSARLDMKNHFGGIVINNDDENNSEPHNVRIHVEKSDINQPELIQTFQAKGATYDAALLNARNTRYRFSQQDSVLKFDYRLQRKLNEPWHDEELEITLKLPLNTKLVIDENLERIIDVNVYECKNINQQPNATSATFTMTTNGLQCLVDTLKTNAIIDSTKTIKR